jgi:UDP-galactopyranose mutase
METSKEQSSTIVKDILAEKLEKLEAIVNAALALQSETDEMHPINLNDVWQLLGWSKKSHAVRNLTHESNMTEGM